MFSGPQVSTICSGSSLVWGTSVISKFTPNRFDNAEITRVRHYPQAKNTEPTKKYLDEQPQISTRQNSINDVRYPMPQFFNCHNKLSEELNGLIAQDRGISFYDPISDTISEYDQNLTHLPEYISDVFFDFTDLLEEVLIVSKRRPLEIINIKVTLEQIYSLYHRIYLLMLSCNQDDILPITNELSYLKGKIDEQGFLPTDKDYESELAETVKTLNDEEKEELACMFHRY